jgi:hypothetical protein
MRETPKLREDIAEVVLAGKPMPKWKAAKKRKRVGVGIMIAHNPLRGSGRADFPHPALTSDNDAKTT